MGQSSSKAADQGNAVTGRAVGITGGGALKRLVAPKLPQGVVKANAEDYQFLEVCSSTCGRHVCAGAVIEIGSTMSCASTTHTLALPE
jgi:hypothetical protein